MHVIFKYFSQTDPYILIGVWFGKDKKTNIIQTHV